MSVDVKKKRKSQKQCSHSDRDDLPLVDPYVTVWVLHCALTHMKPYQHTLLSTVHPQHLIFCTLMHIPPVRPCRAQTHYKTQAAGYERQRNKQGGLKLRLDTGVHLLNYVLSSYIAATSWSLFFSVWRRDASWNRLYPHIKSWSDWMFLKLIEKIILDLSSLRWEEIPGTVEFLVGKGVVVSASAVSFSPLHENMSQPANDLWCLIKMSCLISISLDPHETSCTVCGGFIHVFSFPLKKCNCMMTSLSVRSCSSALLLYNSWCVIRTLQTRCFTFKFIVRNTYLCSKLLSVSCVCWLLSVSLFN